jgi:hypothetical protein
MLYLTAVPEDEKRSTAGVFILKLPNRYESCHPGANRLLLLPPPPTTHMDSESHADTDFISDSAQEDPGIVS